MPSNGGVQLLRYRFSPVSLGYVERIQWPGSRPDPRRRRLLVDGTQAALGQTPTLSLGCVSPPTPHRRVHWPLLRRDSRSIMPATEIACKRVYQKITKNSCNASLPKLTQDPEWCNYSTDHDDPSRISESPLRLRFQIKSLAARPLS